MIADKQYINTGLVKPVLSSPKRKQTDCILDSMKRAVVPFLQAYNLSKSCTLNEDDITEIFYSQVQIIIRNSDYPFNIGNQERDLAKQSKGIPDLFFYHNKLGKPPISIFSIECKRLPTPLPMSREKEYVIGNKNNGGIERFKIEKHGKKLPVCGMIGFVEKETFQYWKTTVKKWIVDLSAIDNFWKNDEILIEADNENHPDSFVLNSIAYRISSENIFLHHLWINL